MRVTGVLELAQLLGAPALGDIASDSLVAPEGTRGIEYRLAAHSEPDLAAAGVVAAELQIAERLARLQHGAMRHPVGLRHVQVTALPAHLAEKLVGVGALDMARAAGGERSKAQRLVLLPVDVCGERREAAKPHLALVERIEPLLSLHLRVAEHSPQW
jgi:hypothetical protein